MEECQRQDLINQFNKGQKRPDDEFIDIMKVLEGLQRVQLGEDLYKYVIEEPTVLDNADGKGVRRVGAFDEVLYTHETRYSNGQLVDPNENRKQSQSIKLGALKNTKAYDLCLRQMSLGEESWFELTSEAVHQNKFHDTLFFKSKTEEEKQGINQTIFIKLKVTKIKRNIDDSSVGESFPDKKQAINELKLFA